MNATTQLETTDVKAEKDTDIAMGNQQPSACEMVKVQRLSRSSEYTQVGGSAGQLTVHVCKDCGTTDLSKFGIRSDWNRPWNYCRACRQERNRPTQRKRADRPEVRAKKQAGDIEYAQRNKESLAAYKADWAAKNRKELAEKRRAKYLENRSEVLQKTAEWKRANPAMVNARSMKRHAGKTCRTPAWLTDFDTFVIQETYDLAQMMTQMTGKPHEVDHILPLHGKTVSGLHVPWNLRVILQSHNASKQNKVEDIVSSDLRGSVLSFIQKRTANV